MAGRWLPLWSILGYVTGCSTVFLTLLLILRKSAWFFIFPLAFSMFMSIFFVLVITWSFVVHQWTYSSQYLSHDSSSYLPTISLSYCFQFHNFLQFILALSNVNINITNVKMAELFVYESAPLRIGVEMNG